MDSCWRYSHVTQTQLLALQPFNMVSCWLYSHLTQTQLLTLQPFNMDSCWLYSHLTHRLICWPQPFNTDSCWLYSHLTHRHSCRLNSHLTQMAVDCTAVQHSHKPLSVCLPLDKWSWYPSHSLHNTHTITNCIVQIYQPYPACVCVCVCVCECVCAHVFNHTMYTCTMWVPKVYYYY